jgi:hypothetical protein
MKNLIIDNNGIQSEPNKNPKTKLEIQIEQLKNQEQQIQKQLKSWEARLKKANNLANCLAAADKFGSKFLDEAVESEKSKEQPDAYWLEYLLKNKVEFNLKFEAGAEAFAKLVLASVEAKVKSLENELGVIQIQLLHQERKFVCLQARRQGKVLLECEYRKSLGCLDEDWCDNCQVNYAVPQSSEQLKGGAC